MDRDIQPRTVPGILDAGFQLYRRHFGLLLTLSLATTFPLRDAARRPSSGGDLVRFMVPIWIALALSTFKGWLVTAALAEALLGGQTSIRATFNRVLPVLPVLIVRWFAFAILLSLGFLALIVPAVLVYLAWLFFSQVVLIEGRGVPAFRRSAELTTGERGRIGILVTVMGLLAACLGQGFHIVGQILNWEVATRTASYAVMVLIEPLESAILLVAYFDLRCRKEGLDLRLRSQALGQPVSLDVVGPA